MIWIGIGVVTVFTWLPAGALAQSMAQIITNGAAAKDNKEFMETTGWVGFLIMLVLFVMRIVFHTIIWSVLVSLWALVVGGIPKFIKMQRKLFDKTFYTFSDDKSPNA